MKSKFIKKIILNYFLFQYINNSISIIKMISYVTIRK
jgi:hypothetical protein